MISGNPHGHRYDVFLNYAIDDRELVSNVAVELRNAGLEIFSSDNELEPDNDIPQTVIDAANTARIGVSFISDSLVAKTLPHYELKTLLKRHRSNKATLIPIFCQLTRYECKTREPPMRGLVKIRGINYKGTGKNPSDLSRELLQRIEEILSKEKNFESFRLVDEYMQAKTEGFCGREWLFDKFNKWFEDPNAKRFLLLTGEPGIGKTAFAAKLVIQDFPERMIAYHFCRHDFPDACSLEYMVFNLISMIGQTLSIDQCSLFTLDQCERDPIGTFKKFVSKDLSTIINTDSSYLMIDGVDEALAEGDHRVIDLFDCFRNLPPTIHVLLTSRSETELLNRIDEKDNIEIPTDNYTNHRDMRAYITQRIEGTKLINQSALPNNSDIVSLLCEKSRGNFAYAKLYLDSLIRGNELNCKLIFDFPEGLYDLYRQYFDRFRDYKKVKWVFELASAAFEPLPIDIIREAADEKQELKNILDMIEPFYKKEGSTYRIFHKSLMDWLTNEQRPNTDFSISLEQGHRRHFNNGYRIFKSGGVSSYWEKYLYQHAYKSGYYLETVKILVGGWGAESLTDVLAVLARNDYAECIHYLLEDFAKVDIDAPASNGRTPLMHAAWEGHVRCCEQLIKAGAHANIRDTKNNDTALILAAYGGHLDCVKILLDQGWADINAQNDNGDTALILAAQTGRPEIVKLLLESNANHRMQDMFGQTALDVARKKGQKACVEILESYKAATGNPHFMEEKQAIARSALEQFYKSLVAISSIVTTQSLQFYILAKSSPISSEIQNDEVGFDDFTTDLAYWKDEVRTNMSYAWKFEIDKEQESGACRPESIVYRVGNEGWYLFGLDSHTEYYNADFTTNIMSYKEFHFQLYVHGLRKFPVNHTSDGVSLRRFETICRQSLDECTLTRLKNITPNSISAEIVVAVGFDAQLTMEKEYYQRCADDIKSHGLRVGPILLGGRDQENFFEFNTEVNVDSVTLQWTSRNLEALNPYIIAIIINK